MPFSSCCCCPLHAYGLPDFCACRFHQHQTSQVHTYSPSSIAPLLTVCSSQWPFPYGSHSQAPNGTQVDTLLAYLDSWTPVNNWYNYPAKQMSAPVTLAKGQPILLTASHCNTASVGLQQVGVIVPSTEPRWASQPEVQQLVLNIDEVRGGVWLLLLWAGSCA